MFDKISRLLEDDFCKTRGIIGCEVAIFQNHKELYHRTCGYNNLEKTEPLKAGSLYFLYSATKPVTVTAAMRLVEEGKLGLDDEVAKYLPEYGKAFINVDGKQVPISRPMLIRHLFTMTAGLNYNLSSPEIQSVVDKYGEAATTRQIVDAFPLRPLLFEPGERFEYSLCHDVLAAVVEVVSGKTFSEYLAETILDPLGMVNTGFKNTADVCERMATHFTFDSGKMLVKEKKNIFVKTEAYESGGAGLISSVDDYAKFVDTLASGGVSKDGYRLLKPETINLMRSVQLQPNAVASAFCCAPGQGYGYGYGVRTRVSSEGGRGPMGEFGWDGAAGAYLLVDPENKLSIFFATHLFGWTRVLKHGHCDLRNLVYEILQGE